MSDTEWTERNLRRGRRLDGCALIVEPPTAAWSCSVEGLTRRCSC